MNYNRIQDSVSIPLLQDSHIVIVGAGGSKNLITNLARTGIGKLTVLDFDTVDDTNLVRQGYEIADIGTYKVDALEKEIKRINPDVVFKGITDNFLEMSEGSLDTIFKHTDMLLFLTDSFKAQSFGNTLALKYQKPSLWAGWYAKSRTAEIFFQIPSYTPACFRCAVSSRYKAHEKEDIQITSHCNTIFHSVLLDSYIGLLTLAVLHRDYKGEPKESKLLFDSLLNENDTLDWNFLHLKVHPKGGNPFFDECFEPLGKRAQNFVSHWQRVEPELKPKYDYDCPDCKGSLLGLVTVKPNSDV